MKQNIAFGFLGINLDSGKSAERWMKWRPSVDLCRQEDLAISRYEILCDPKYGKLAEFIAADIRQISPETEVIINELYIQDPWDLEEVYEALFDFVDLYPFNTDAEEYLLNITTGTHVTQICMFLLNEARFLPGKILQLSPPRGREKSSPGSYDIIDLDLSKYDNIADRFKTAKDQGNEFLKAGIPTRNAAFNAMIEEIEHVAIRTTNPVLLSGPTGTGKGNLARRIYELKKRRHQIEGEFISINCATLRGEAAMSALFGHKRGAYAGATKDREGLLMAAHKGVVFLDEIEALGPDEQAMILGALEDKAFYPLGGDKATRSDFQLIAGTAKDLDVMVADGHFRADLLARINMWSYELPALSQRREDIEPNIDFELMKFGARHNQKVAFNKEARTAYLKFALSAEAKWKANFRDLTASITRLCTFAGGKRIGLDYVDKEIERLRRSWRLAADDPGEDVLLSVMSRSQIEALDPFDRPGLANVITVCRASDNLSDAGRKLYAISRTQRKTTNDSDRLKKYLAKYGLSWATIT